MSEKKLIVNKCCNYELLNDEIIILNQETGKYHELNSTGKIIFSKIIEIQLSKKELIEKINEEYKDNINISEVDEFINDLFQRKIIFEQ
tara:strand:- start:1176 stop:1442 length:267 start_codon:yes stop_codon:yes gene_type:complete